MSEGIKWNTLNKSNIRRLVGSAPLNILAVRRDGKGYFGVVSQQYEEYVEIQNGDHRQNLYYSGSPTLFAVIETPPAPTFKMGERRLKLEGHSDGQREQ